MNGLKRVSIEGKTYPVFYGMYGLAQLMKQHEITFSQLQEKLAALGDITKLGFEEIEFLYDFIYAGFEMGAKVTKEDFDLCIEEIAAALPMNSDGFNAVFEAFAESMPQPEEVSQKKAKKVAVKR